MSVKVVLTDGLGSVIKFPYSRAELRADNPSTSFPVNITEEQYAEYNVYPVYTLPQPTFDISTQNASLSSIPTYNSNTGVWELSWNITSKTQEEKDAYRASIVRRYELQVQSYMDEKVAERQYDSMISAATYATSSNPKYGPEGQACVVWRDAVWDKCYEVLAAVDAGTRQQPTVAELIAELPVLVWPD